MDERDFSTLRETMDNLKIHLADTAGSIGETERSDSRDIADHEHNRARRERLMGAALGAERFAAREVQMAIGLATRFQKERAEHLGEPGEAEG